MKKAALIAVAAVLATPALAKAPEPAKAVPTSFFAGRWYEIVRTPNFNQADCEAPTYEFRAPKAAKIDFVLTCRKGTPTGKAVARTVTLHLPQDEAKNKFKVTSGPFSVGYVVIDRADDNSWWILGTDGGRYVWLLARTPSMGASEKGAIKAKLKGFGYQKLEEPKQG